MSESLLVALDPSTVDLAATAAGAIVGAVMKATRGQADAARVRELVLAACGVEG